MPEPKDSYRRCLNTARFADRHYELLMGSDPRVRSFFAEIDPAKHKGTLRGMHVALLKIAEGDDLAIQYVRRVAAKHGPSGLDVPEELYECWLSSLIEAVRDCDPEFSPSVERAWREVGQSAIEVLTDALQVGGSGR